MNKIAILSVDPCDQNNNPLPASPTVNNTRLISVSPKPLGNTGALNVKIDCNLVPAGSGNIKYRLTLSNLSDWNFSTGNGSELEITINTSNGKAEHLPFELKNLNATTNSVTVTIEAMDPGDPPPNKATDSFTLSDK